MQPSGINTRTLLALVVLSGLLATATSARGDVLSKPSEIRRLGAATIAPDQTQDVLLLAPTGGVVGAYVVPEKRVLVITTITFRPISFGTGFIEVDFLRGLGGNNSDGIWKVPTDRPTQLQLPTGLVISSGETLRLENRASSETSVHVDITGYEAKDR